MDITEGLLGLLSEIRLNRWWSRWPACHENHAVNSQAKA